MTGDNIWSLAEAYVAGSLPVAEANALKTRLATDAVFAAEFNECANLLRSLNGSGEQMRFRAMLTDIRKTAKPKTVVETRSIPLRTHYFRTAGVAAGIALLTSLTTFWAIQHNNKKIASQYSLLRRDLETYKRSQNQIINNIKDQKSRPVAPVRYTGTGFAVTNDGYLVTNYHVTEGADSIYIQNRDGQYFKTTLVSFDEKADVALLKVEDKYFRFGKTEVPYSFETSKRKLGTKIFTLGFPQDEIVYNQGYISSKNGFDGDSLQYRLQIPASPGHSGAPVVDDQGQVVAIITGKESETEGTTYAVGAKAIAQLLSALPKENRIHLSKTNKLSRLTREQQIEKLEYYTCAIKVYKK
jgi:S1-C subfamily serine protease